MLFIVFILKLICCFIIKSERDSFKSNILNVSLLKLNKTGNLELEKMEYFEIPEKFPKLYPSLNIITINPLIIPNKKLFNATNIEVSINCYQELPNYSLKKGLLLNYSKFLLDIKTKNCQDFSSNVNEFSCKEINDLYNLVNNVITKITSEYKLKTNDCFDLHLNVFSAHDFLLNNNNGMFKGNKIKTEKSMMREKMIFVIRQISFFEIFYLELKKKFDRYCINNEKYQEEGVLDCKLLFDSCIIFEKKIPKLLSFLNTTYTNFLKTTIR